MEDLILIVIILLIVGAAVAYIVKAKKQGVKCIGCPHAKECKGHQNEMDGRRSSCNGMCSGCGK